MIHGQRTRIVWGATSTLAMMILAALIWGRSGVVSAGAFGVVATVLQLVAARAMHRTGAPPAVDQVKVYALGVILRMLGVLILGVVVMVDRHTFPPLPAAMGYLGTVLTLLYLETRLAEERKPSAPQAIGVR